MLTLSDIMTEFSSDILQMVRTVMETAVNEKSGTTLKGSDIFKAAQVKATHNGDLVFDIILNDYITYIESGRRKGAKFPPVEPIINWARKRGIPTDNQTIFLIRRAIARDGIRPRPIMAQVFDFVDEEWDKRMADRLFVKITSIIDEYFKKP